jgi:hypothetical protein
MYGVVLSTIYHPCKNSIITACRRCTCIVCAVQRARRARRAGVFGSRRDGQPLYATARVDDSTGQRVNVPQPFSASTGGPAACVCVCSALLCSALLCNNFLPSPRAPCLPSALAPPAMPVPSFAFVFCSC